MKQRVGNLHALREKLKKEGPNEHTDYFKFISWWNIIIMIDRRIVKICEMVLEYVERIRVCINFE